MSDVVLIGLSGGVDSSLAAILLKEQGYDVIGVSMSIYNKDIPNLIGGNACYGPFEKPEITNIHEFGKKIGIKTFVFDCSEEYKNTILSYFQNEYKAGRTPNPCVKCNELMKFGLLLQKAESEGIAFDYFATGHYCQTEYKDGRYLLKKGIDEKKDQSYFLYKLNQTQLSKVIFPLGSMTKEEVRRIAKEKGLDVADKADSQDFYSGNYNDLLQMPIKKGNIMLPNGTVLGVHNGYWNYTIGQRKGLGVSYSEPLFVLDMDAHRNIVWVGTQKDAQKTECYIEDLHWIKFDKPADNFKAFAKQRSTAKPAAVSVSIYGDKAKIKYEDVQKSFTPGQSLVLYDGDYVIGGGIICKE
ncbi:MAG: tRNA 2-thiouridine(34) synthase MnmA [Alphaproteobacteria bacterium]|nr:tRNA 2-thiouridine(34) synthase MnmA [Alphaproteobacteria bacterium]